RRRHHRRTQIPWGLRLSGGQEPNFSDHKWSWRAPFSRSTNNVGLLAQLPCWTSTESDRSRQFPNEPEVESLSDRGGQNPLALADFGSVVTKCLQFARR